MERIERAISSNVLYAATNLHYRVLQIDATQSWCLGGQSEV